jgi:glycosyltransferase involved in cell wall biosynthesis
MANILRIITWLPVGGIEQKLVAILPMIHASGKHRVRLCCLRERGPLADDLEKAGVPVEVVPFRSRWDMRAIRRLIGLMKEWQIDVVHSHMYRSNVPGTVAARFARVPVTISQLHNVDTWETRRQKWVDRSLMRWRDAVVCVSEAVRRDAIARIGLSKEKARVIYNGVDINRFASPSPEAGARVRTEWGLPDGAVVALMLSRLHPQKNPLGLLEAFGRVAGMAPRLHLVYAGDGPQREELLGEIQRRGLSGRVHAVGVRRDIPDVLAAADFCVLPSFKEGLSNTILESMAASKAMLCTDVGGNGEIVIPGETGFIEQAGDIEALAHSLQRLANDAALRQVFGEAARRTVKRFSLERMAQDTMELYEELLKRKGRI